MTTTQKERRAVSEEPFCRETERKKRRELLQLIVQDQGEDTLSTLRRAYMDRRYSVQNGNDVDYFIRGWVELSAIRENGLFPGRKKAAAKRAKEALAWWHPELAAENGAAGELALFGELYNMTRLYIRLCGQDRTYGSVLWGFGHVSGEKLTSKIASEVRRLTCTLPEWLGMQEEFGLFSEAASLAFRDYFPEAEEL